MDFDRAPPMPVADYREAQRAMPGVDALYRIARAIMDAEAADGARVLVVGAGGGRELESLGASPRAYRLTALDPSADMLDLARQFGPPGRTDYVRGLIDDLPDRPDFDAATALLVMHFLPDDGAKLAFLRAIRRRLRPNAVLILADISWESPLSPMLVPAFLAHGEAMGLDATLMRGAADMIQSQLSVIDAARTGELLAAAGFGAPVPVWRGLWYAAWAARAVVT